MIVVNLKTSKNVWLLGLLFLLSTLSWEIAAQTTQNINVCKLKVDRYGYRNIVGDISIWVIWIKFLTSKRFDCTTL